MTPIPRIKFEIDEKDKLSGVKVISLVSEPAIDSDFVFFNKAKSNYIELKGAYKQVVAGLALIPDKDILRYDSKGEPFYGFFSKDTIESIRNKFHKELLTNKVNTEHSADNYVDAYLIESFLIDSPERLADVKAKGIEDATDGSWFVEYKIEDKQTFEKVLKGELRGFSVEIFLQKFYKNNSDEKEQTLMNKILDKLKTFLAEAEKEEVKKFEEAKDPDGNTIKYGAVGDPVVIVAADGSETPAKDGDYQLDNGKIVSVVSGVASDIKDAPVEQKKGQPVQEPKQDTKLAEELNSVKTERENLKSEIEKLKAEVEKLKKAPLANPALKQELKKSNKLTDAEFDKLSNVEQILYKKGLLELN